MSNKSPLEPGDVIIESINLVKINSSSAEVNLLDLIVRADIYESIKSPIITGNITILDSINLRETYPIVSDKCKVIIKFKSHPDLPTRTFDLLIKNISEVTSHTHSQFSTYDLSLCSIEILNNSKQLFTKPLREKKIHEYVDYIMTDIIGTKKRMISDPSGTKGVQSLDIIQMKPFQSIDFLRRRAVSASYKSSTYSFFENKRGFNFVPIEYLFERKGGKIEMGEYYYDSDVKTNVKNVTYKNIIAYDHLVQQSTPKMLQEGALRNVTTSLDIRTRTYRTVDFDLSKEFSNFKFTSTAKKINTPDFEQQYSRTPTVTNYIINTSKNPDNYLVDKIGFNKSFTELLTQNVLRIFIWGDSTLSAGYRIQCRLPAFQGLTNQKGIKKNESSKFLSGEYLISSIRHSFTRLQNKYRYNISTELIKGTYGEARVGGQ